MTETATSPNWERFKTKANAWIEKKIPAFSDNSLQIAIVMLFAFITLLVVLNFVNHGFIVISGVVIFIALAYLGIGVSKENDVKDTDQAAEWKLFGLTAGTSTLFLPMFWLVYGFVPFLSLSIFVVAFWALLLMELIPVRSLALVVAQTMAIIIALSVTWAIPSERVSETTAGIYTYEEHTRPFALLGERYVGYHNLRNEGYLQISELPEHWSVGVQFLVHRGHEQESDAWGLIEEYKKTGTSVLNIDIPLDENITLHRDRSSVPEITAWLEELYPFFDVQVSQTYSFTETRTYTE